MSRVLVGQEALVEHVLVGLVARGHVLIEGVPGLGMTLLVRAVSRVIQSQAATIPVAACRSHGSSRVKR